MSDHEPDPGAAAKRTPPPSTPDTSTADEDTEVRDPDAFEGGPSVDASEVEQED